jgi:hypothetical protein
LLAAFARLLASHQFGRLAAAAAMRYDEAMMRRPLAILALLLLAMSALSAAGCTKCGFFWEDGQRACHSEAPR